MLTLAVPALLLGACMLIASGTSVLLRLGGSRERTLVHRCGLTPITSWPRKARRVAGVGTTAYGPGGPVLGPVSGVECAWYRMRLTRTPARRLVREEPGEDILVELTAPQPSALTDESGTVLIDPDLSTEPPNPHDPLATNLTVHLLGPSDADTWAAIVPAEIRLEAGKRVNAMGSTRRGTLCRNGFSVLTTDHVDAVLDGRVERVASTRQLARTLGLAGLVITLLSVGALLLIL
ncbi:MAG TPA: hypothetical protein VFW65_24565 [Pseudonocardiaceae bacterium]|nr:hypothetical protein [Pseudonocardiaceae bacterium]